MTRVPVLQLREKNQRNRWVVGTSPALARDDPFYSEQIQIWNGWGKKEGEKLHWHYPPIEEYYLVLEGTVSLQIGNQEQILGPSEMVRVGPNMPHRVLEADNSWYLTIRAPVSTDDEKTDLSTACSSQIRIKSGPNVTILQIPTLRPDPKTGHSPS